MSADEPGLLGNLPKSRPGTRSAKRGSATTAPGKAGRANSRQPTAAARPRTPAAAPPESGDPVTGALRGAAKVAGAGLRVADGVTREVLRRLPRR